MRLLLKISTLFKSVSLAACSVVAFSVPSLADAHSDALFVTPGELPSGFKMTESHDSVADDSGAFKKYSGKESGIRVFQAGETATLQRVVDMWWAFPSAELADKFFQDSQKELSEGMPLVLGAKEIGDKSFAYGGENKMGAMLGGDSFYSWAYVVRSGRFVMKVYGAEGPSAKAHPTLQMLAPIAEAASRHCDAYDRSPRVSTFDEPAGRKPIHRAQLRKLCGSMEDLEDFKSGASSSYSGYDAGFLLRR